MKIEERLAALEARITRRAGSALWPEFPEDFEIVYGYFVQEDYGTMGSELEVKPRDDFTVKQRKILIFLNWFWSNF